jgi:Zn-dependent protease
MRYPRRAAWMALAGPASNLVLIVIAGILINLGVMANLFHSPESVSFGHVTAANASGFMNTVAFVLGVIFSLNLVLFILNMLPIPPLDGSGALPLLLSDELIPRYQQFIWTQPYLGWIGIFVAWQVFDRIFQPVFLVAVNLLYPGVSYH